MGELKVQVDELHTHAVHLRGIHERFQAVQDASAHISGGEDAYGALCSFFPAILKERHDAQEELVREIAFNITSLAGAVSDSADDYEEADKQNSSSFKAINSSTAGPVAP
ncbi:type VII secretion target [Glycomyces sp. NPDC047010]|uniref:type VII secretion target n=1 Tax=Glycomyces sp. NPDC047010 TaxID=3155023 RepID=UPI0033FA0B83